MTTDTWLPVHEFCQLQKVPCLFPNTSLPVTDTAAFCTVYWSGYEPAAALRQAMGRVKACE